MLVKHHSLGMLAKMTALKVHTAKFYIINQRMKQTEQLIVPNDNIHIRLSMIAVTYEQSNRKLIIAKPSS